MTRKADQLLRHLERELERRVARIEPNRAHPILADRRRLLAPGGSVESGDHIVGETEDLGRFADRRARAIGDHRGREAGALAPIVIVDILDHLFAPLVLEVDVDVGRLVALGRNEALEQKIETLRIDLGDPEAIADSGIGRRAAALAEDSLRAREAHDVVHGEEVRRVIERGDQLEFVRQRFPRALRNALGIARFCAGFHESLKRLLRRRIACAQLLGIAMGQFVEAEVETVEEAERLGEGSGASANSRAISRGSLRWRSALAWVRRPAASSVVFSRMQVRTSASARRSGACMSASLVAIRGAPTERASAARCMSPLRMFTP